ncbi:hypothetical protein [Paenimyroides ceti]|uniref:hypothetical protein n=1 Tax=Paenimyroides ceti TaxID=395087 RepID=UPI00294FFF61|nr:hypothetical protein [Paenimyroides ceti]
MLTTKKKRPYVILKWAASADGFIAPLHKEELKPVWISNIYSRQLTHKCEVKSKLFWWEHKPSLMIIRL